MQKLITPYASDFGKANIVIKHFPDTESYVLVPKINSLKNKKVTIYHRLYPEPEKRIFELLLILSRVKKETRDIELFAPYFPYARQDKENKPGEAVSADVLCNLLQSHGVKKLITYDCHFLPKPGNFKRSGLHIENKSAGKQLSGYAKKYFEKEKFLVISPDQGASYFLEHGKGHTLNKKRAESKATGKKTEIYADVHVMEGDIDVYDKNICILDDMIETGSTIIRAIEHLRKFGTKKIIVGTTHGVFGGENVVEKILKSSCDHLFTTNSIPQNENNKVKVLEL